MQVARTAGADCLKLRTSLSEIGRLSPWIDRMSGGDMTGETIFALQLCLEEAVANVVMYSGASEDSPIWVQFTPNARGATVVIEDSGRPFDPTSVPARVQPTSLEEARIGELGVHLIRHYSNGMHYERIGSRNRLTLLFDSNAMSKRT